MRKKGVPVNTLCKVTDISLGGCYVELMMPFPEGTSIELDLSWQDRKQTIDARVCNLTQPSAWDFSFSDSPKSNTVFCKNSSTLFPANADSITNKRR